jgi:hypothetical protein
MQCSKAIPQTLASRGVAGAYSDIIAYQTRCYALHYASRRRSAQERQRIKTLGLERRPRGRCTCISFL